MTDATLHDLPAPLLANAERTLLAPAVARALLKEQGIAPEKQVVVHCSAGSRSGFVYVAAGEPPLPHPLPAGLGVERQRHRHLRDEASRRQLIRGTHLPTPLKPKPQVWQEPNRQF